MLDLSNWDKISVNYEIDGKIALLATLIFNSECPEHLRKYIKKRIVIRQLKKMIKRLLDGISTYGNDDPDGISESNIYDLFHFASHLETWNGRNPYYSYEKLCKDVHNILLNMQFSGF